MKVEAQKVENGFFIPAVDGLRTILAERVWLHIEIVTQDSPDLDEIDRFFAPYQFAIDGLTFDREKAHAC
ncbi:hypothetical protein CSA56_06645 [candidate division KSB3 bacterium]|uniref:Uncharacterized protein n=1 Tax=candidate division KSB3 bacterium TaxID=2044937 RepID=A0A2G6KJ22_9BACT|nr:MAG: hypothetical protein CSA56_06645 [candidate division KSB3 bacterium]